MIIMIIFSDTKLPIVLTSQSILLQSASYPTAKKQRICLDLDVDADASAKAFQSASAQNNHACEYRLMF